LFFAPGSAPGKNMNGETHSPGADGHSQLKPLFECGDAEAIQSWHVEKFAGCPGDVMAVGVCLDHWENAKPRHLFPDRLVVSAQSFGADFGDDSGELRLKV